MMTFYFIGVAMTLFIILVGLAYSTVNEKSNKTNIGTIVLLASGSWLTIFIIVMVVIFLKLKKGRLDGCRK